MVSPSFEPEAIDLAVLREMYRDGAVNLVGIDPRINATRVARSLRIGRSRVAARMRWWRSSGFLRSYAVWVNPALFGWQAGWVAVRLAHHREKPALFERLKLIDGVVSAIEFLGEWVSVAIVAPDAATFHRRLELLRHFAGVVEVDTPMPWSLPEPKRPLSSLDLRVVRALRERPEAALHDTARRVGISTRTMTRKYAALLDELAIWFVPVFDFRVFSRPVVALTLFLRPHASREGVAAEVRKHYPLTLPAGPGGGESPEHLTTFVILPSAAHQEELERFAAGLPEVAALESYLLVRFYDYPEWFDRLVSARDPSPGGSDRRPRPADARRDR